MNLPSVSRRAALGLIAAGLPASAALAAKGKGIDSLLEAVLARTGAPALAAAVFSSESTAFFQARGVRRIDQSTPVGPHDRWHIGSNAKSMTAAVYARLVQDGRARWRARLDELFPDLTLDPAWRAVRIEDLLHHRSGIRDLQALISSLVGPSGGRDPASVRDQRSELARQVLGAPPVGPRGVYEYSNANYILAGAAIERICDTTWEAAIAGRLFDPLAMTSFGFDAPRGEQPWGHRDVHGIPTPIDPNGPDADNPVLWGPAGRVHLNLSDYLSYLRLFIGGPGAGDLLSADSLTRLTTPPADGEPYAMGWGVVPDIPWAAGPLLAHDGSNERWYATTRLSPARQLGVTVISNDGQRGAKAVQLAAAILMQYTAPA